MSEPKLNGCALGKSHEKKAAFLLDFVQITSPTPLNLDNFYNFFLTPKTEI